MLFVIALFRYSADCLVGKYHIARLQRWLAYYRILVSININIFEYVYYIMIIKKKNNIYKYLY